MISKQIIYLKNRIDKPSSFKQDNIFSMSDDSKFKSSKAYFYEMFSFVEDKQIRNMYQNIQSLFKSEFFSKRDLLEEKLLNNLDRGQQIREISILQKMISNVSKDNKNAVTSNKQTAYTVPISKQSDQIKKLLTNTYSSMANNKQDKQDSNVKKENELTNTLKNSQINDKFPVKGNLNKNVGQLDTFKDNIPKTADVKNNVNKQMVKVQGIQAKMQQGIKNSSNVSTKIDNKSSLPLQKSFPINVSSTQESESPLKNKQVVKLQDSQTNGKQGITKPSIVSTKKDNKDNQPQKKSLSNNVSSTQESESPLKNEQIPFNLINFGKREPPKSQGSQYERRQDLDDQKSKQNIKILMKLVGNRFNQCSSHFLSNLNNHLLKYSYVFDEIDFGNVRQINNHIKNNNDFSKLNDEEINEIINISNKIIANKDKMKEKEYIEKQISQQSQALPQLQASQSSYQSLRVEDIMKLIKNKTNFCHEQFLQQVEDILEGVKCYLNCFQLKSIYEEGYKQISWDILQNSQIDHLNALAQNISQMSTNYPNEYEFSLSPKHEIQPNSQVISELINISSKEKKVQLDLNRINALLVLYPIFDGKYLRQPGERIQMPFQNTQFLNSKDLEISNNSNGMTYIKQAVSTYGSAISTMPLFNDLVYVMRVHFNKPYESSFISIGLINSNDIDLNFPNEDCLSGFCSNIQQGKSMVRGGNLTSNNIANQSNYLEFRICIATKQFYFADYPLYNNINAVNNVEDQFDPSQSYHLGIGFGAPGDDWNITISDIFVFENQENIMNFN